jgi:uncharacterized DUF497 family protein
MKFVWDDDKAEQNFTEHGVSFEQVRSAFTDPKAIEEIDWAHSTETEIRRYIIGLAAPGLLYVVFTEPDEYTIRIIHARIANPGMGRYYEKENKRK